MSAKDNISATGILDSLELNSPLLSEALNNEFDEDYFGRNVDDNEEDKEVSSTIEDDHGPGTRYPSFVDWSAASGKDLRAEELMTGKPDYSTETEFVSHDCDHHITTEEENTTQSQVLGDPTTPGSSKEDHDAIALSHHYSHPRSSSSASISSGEDKAVVIDNFKGFPTCQNGANMAGEREPLPVWSWGGLKRIWYAKKVLWRGANKDGPP